MSELRHRFHRASAVSLAVALTASLAIAAGCRPGAPAPAEMPAPKVTVTPVVVRETIDADEYTGQTAASEMVEVRSRVFGYLKSVDFRDGDFVREGQTLFTIEPDEYEAIHKQSLARIDVQTANLELAKSKLARNENLVKSGAVSREEYEESVAAVSVAEASIVAAKADANRTAVDLKYTKINAPIGGRIDRALVTKGNLLTGGMSSGTLLTRIVNEQPMYVYFDVDERSLLGYRRQGLGDRSRSSDRGHVGDLGLACYLQLADEPDYSHEGQIDFAAAEVDTSTGTARIRGVFANQDRKLVSGLFVRIRIPISKPYQALMVPERSLATDQSVKFVYVVGSDGTATRRSIELGAQRGDMRIVKSGLKEGEQVIVKGLQRVRPGQKVEAELEPSAPEAAAPASPGTAKATPQPAAAASPAPVAGEQPSAPAAPAAPQPAAPATK